MCVESETLCPFLKGCKLAYLVFHKRDWSQECCHGNNTGVILFSFVMYISGAKFEELFSNISKDILDSVFYCLSGTIYDIIAFPISTIQECKYL